MVRLGDIQFSSWNQARQHHLTLLRQYKDRYKHTQGVVISKQHKDFPFLHDLFLHHPERERKLKGCRLHHFEFGPDENTTSRWCCYVVNRNKKRVMWSARQIGVSRRKRDRARLKSILRIEVSGQRDRFARQHPAMVLCQDCGCQLRNKRTKQGSKQYKHLPVANVDHDVQQGQAFIETYRGFRKKMVGMHIETTWTQRYHKNVQVLANRTLARQWRRYHKRKTVYRFLCIKCNNQSYNKA